MAHCSSTLLPFHFSPSNVSTKKSFNYPIQSSKPISRRSANYKPNSWNPLSPGSPFRNDHGVEKEKETIKRVEEIVWCILEDEGMEALTLLQLIDDVHRLGVAYRMRKSVDMGLQRILRSSNNVKEKLYKSLHASALYFRLLRQHGYEVSTDIFARFKDSRGEYYTHLSTDVHGMLSLYEASHLAFVGEETMDDAREFTSFHLKNMLGKIDKNTRARVCRALEVPSHHRVHRLDARWNIETYDKQNQANHLLHTLSLLDFNMVQSIHRQELQETSRWWADVGLAKELSFARERLIESFFWATGMVFQTRYTVSRKELAKVGQLITIIDDIFDVYGTLEELELFTDAVERWDLSGVSHLPRYMQLCFLALFNTANNVGYCILKEQGHIVIPHLQKLWGDMCKAFLQEAKWMYGESTVKLDEYMNNGFISSSGPLILFYAFVLTAEKITEEALNYLTEYQGLSKFASQIFRLANDLASYEAETKRGETTNAISCFMQETGESEEAGRAYVRRLIDENWKLMNREIVYNSTFDKSFVEFAINLARMSLCQYQYGDAHSSPDDTANDRVSSVLFDPIPFASKT